MMLGKSSSHFFIPVDNVKIQRYTKFEQNIPSGTRVMNIFTKRAQSARMMFDEASSPLCTQKLDNVKLQKYSKQSKKKKQKKNEKKRKEKITSSTFLVNADA